MLILKCELQIEITMWRFKIQGMKASKASNKWLDLNLTMPV